jgi:hypothetical protein
MNHIQGLFQSRLLPDVGYDDISDVGLIDIFKHVDVRQVDRLPHKKAYVAAGSFYQEEATGLDDNLISDLQSLPQELANGSALSSDVGLSSLGQGATSPNMCLLSGGASVQDDWVLSAAEYLESVESI